MFGSANSGFGNTTGGGLFGNKPASTGFGTGNASGNTNTSPFGASNTSSAPMFGSSSNNNTTNNSTGGLFGAKNTSAPSGGLFGGLNTANTGGNQPQNNTQGGLFSQGNTTNQFGSAPKSTFGAPASSGGLFGNNNNTNQASGGGLFGNSSTTQNSGATSGGLFGSSNTQNQTGATGGGLFGSNNNTANNSSGQSSLFGSNSTTSTGGLFGGNSGTTNNTSSGGLFGGNSNTNTSTGGGLFGNSNTSSAPKTGLFGGNNQSSGGLFGGSNQNSGGLFGNNNNTNQGSNSLFGGASNNTLNNTSNSQQPQLTAMTRVSELSPQMKKELEDFDQYINTQHLIASTLQADMEKHDHLITSIPKDTNYLHNKLTAVNQGLRFDFSQLQNLKDINNELSEDLSKIMQLIIQLSTPGTKLSSSIQLNEFFVRKIKKYHEVIASYREILQEVEDVIGGLERLCAEGFGGLFNIVAVIKSQYNLFMELCDNMAQIHNQVTKLK